MGYRPESVAVGPKGSGTEAIAKAIIAEQGYDITAPAIVNLTSAEARHLLLEGKLDVGFFVTSYRDHGAPAQQGAAAHELPPRAGLHAQVPRAHAAQGPRGPARSQGQHPAREHYPALAVRHAGGARQYQPARGRARAQGRPSRQRAGRSPRPRPQVPNPRGHGPAGERSGGDLSHPGRVLPLPQPALSGAQVGPSPEAADPAPARRVVPPDPPGPARRLVAPRPLAQAVLCAPAGSGRQARHRATAQRPPGRHQRSGDAPQRGAAGFAQAASPAAAGRLSLAPARAAHPERGGRAAGQNGKRYRSRPLGPSEGAAARVERRPRPTRDEDRVNSPSEPPPRIRLRGQSPRSEREDLPRVFVKFGFLKARWVPFRQRRMVAA